MSKECLKVLFVLGGNSSAMPFITEQAESLKKLGLEIDEFKIIGKGAGGYLRSLRNLRKLIKNGGYSIVHAHYGLSGVLAVLQRIAPVVITYHGSDINQKYVRGLSLLAGRLSAANIYVSGALMKKAGDPKNAYVIPCGIDTDLFMPIEKKLAKKQLNLEDNKKYILFSSNFDNPVKNFELARSSIAKLNLEGIEVLELKGLSRDEVALTMNAAEVLLMTSFSEGSPQVVKEALACNLPVISTDVGDVADQLEGIANSYIVPFDKEDIAAKLALVLGVEQIFDSRSRVLKLSLDEIANEVLAIYQKVALKE